MSLLDQIVELRIGDILKDVAISDWHVISGERDSCAVITADFRIDFFIDNRGGEVSSTIEYINEPERHRFRIPMRIVADLFPDVDFIRDSGHGDTASRINNEIRNIGGVLKEIKKNEISPRDIYYFFMGHNAGYTLSSKLM